MFCTLATGNDWRYEILLNLFFRSFCFSASGLGVTIDADKVIGMFFEFARKVYSGSFFVAVYGSWTRFAKVKVWCYAVSC